MKGLDIKHNRIAVIGFGVSGKSVTQYFLKHGVLVDVFEDKKIQDFDQTQLENFKTNENFAIQYDATQLSIDVAKYDYVIASPGVPQTHKIVLEAKKAGIEFVTDITIFLRMFRAQYPFGKVVSITGSNGKSTTVSLMYHALLATTQDVYLGGNIGTSPLDFFEIIKTDKPLIILETSSYQLEYLKEQDYFDIAGITNISDNHLNRYEGKKELYAKAKLGGINSDTDVIINFDDEETLKYIVPYLLSKRVLGIDFKSQNNSNVITFENNSLIHKDTESSEVLLQDTTQMKLKGLHNTYNTAFVCAVCVLLDIEMTQNVQEAIYSFGGLIHRTQFVDEINSISYINDSKSTSPDATSKALSTLGVSKNIILISGGNDKDISYDAMKEGWIDFVSSLILLPGSANPKLKTLAHQSNVEVLGEIETMTDAVEIAVQHAQEGDIVLLSPATDSHASFKSFEDRGNQFIQCVQELKN